MIENHSDHLQAIDGAIVGNQVHIVAVCDDVMLSHHVFQEFIGRFTETDFQTRQLGSGYSSGK